MDFWGQELLRVTFTFIDGSIELDVLHTYQCYAHYP